jgi:NADH dehydrogenase
LLAEVASGALEPQHISAPVRAACGRARVRRATVEAIDLQQRLVSIHAGPGAAAESVGYDHLVLALGSVPTFRDLPGLEEHAFALKSLGDASALRNHVLGLLELADAEPDPSERCRMLTFVVVGVGSRAPRPRQSSSTSFTRSGTTTRTSRPKSSGSCSCIRATDSCPSSRPSSARTR